MKELIWILFFLMGIAIQSCIPSSSTEIKKVDRPDSKIKDEFGIKANGKIIYQFYEKYGFTDIEEHLIMIVKLEDFNFLNSSLPFDSTDLKRLIRINLKKFALGKPINIEFEMDFNEDVRIESMKYDDRQLVQVYYGDGKYRITSNDSVETIYLFDKMTGLMYVESKKIN